MTLILPTPYPEMSSRLFQWAVQDALRERRENLRYVRRLRSSSAIAYVTFVNQLDQQAGDSFVAALVKRAHSQLVEQVSELSKDEFTLLQRFESYKAVNLWKWIESSNTRPIIDQRSLRRAITTALGRVFSDAPERWEGGILKYRVPFKPWFLDTYIDLGRLNRVYYHHEIAFEQMPPMPQALSLMSWLGVSETEWGLSRLEDSDDCVHLLVDLCQHFVQMFSSMVKHDCRES